MFRRLFRGIGVTAIALIALGSVRADAQQGAVKIFEQQNGPWKASCFRDPGEPAPYCRIMALKMVGPDGMAMNFAQFGAAWDRGQTGIIVATYLGFARKSKVSLQVDDIEPWTVKAPDTNHVITPPPLTPIILEAMQNGKTMTLVFKPANGGEETLSVELASFRELIGPVNEVLDKHAGQKTVTD